MKTSTTTMTTRVNKIKMMMMMRGSFKTTTLTTRATSDDDVDIPWKEYLRDVPESAAPPVETVKPKTTTVVVVEEKETEDKKGVQRKRANAETTLANTNNAKKSPAKRRETRELFPDVPDFVYAPVKSAVETTLDAVTPSYETYAPTALKSVVEAQWNAERASGFSLYAGANGGAETELGIYAAVVFYLFAKPGFLPWVFDVTVARAVGAVTERRFAREDVNRGRRLGSGSFGNVFAATDARTGQELVIKIANGVEGSSQLQNAEAYINRRVARAPLVARGCAPFLGAYYEVEGAASPSLVWAYEAGERTLENFLESRRFPEDLEDALGMSLPSSSSMSYEKRVNRVAKRVMKDLLPTVAGLHDIGIVHRDLKPSNLVLMGKRFKLIDFGAACDLRSGENYDPEQGLLDPRYSPPEQFIMSKRTPAPPPVVAGVLAPLLWTLAQPQLFDSYSVGLMLLQLCVPQMRNKNITSPGGAFARRLEDCDYDLRKFRAETEAALGWDFSAMDLNGGLAWDLACGLVTKRNVFRRGRLDVGAALAHPFIASPF